MSTSTAKELRDKQLEKEAAIIARDMHRNEFDAVFDGLAQSVTGFTVEATTKIVDAIVASYNGNVILKGTCQDFILQRGRFGGDDGSTARTTHMSNFCTKHSVHYAQLSVAERKAKADKLSMGAVLEIPGFTDMKRRNVKSAISNIVQQTTKLYKAMAGLYNIDNVREVTVNPVSNQVFIRYMVDGHLNNMLQYGEELARKFAVPSRGKGENPAGGANLVETCSHLESLLAAHPDGEVFTTADSEALQSVMALLTALQISGTKPDKAITSTEGDAALDKRIADAAAAAAA